MRRDSARQTVVRRNESGVQRFGQRDVHGVVGRHVGAELEDAAQQHDMPVAREREVDVVGQRFVSTLRRERLGSRQPA